MAKTTHSTKAPDQMTESELADYYYEHREGPSGEAVTSVAPKRMDVMISARFSGAEAAQLREAAERSKMSISAFIRERALSSLTAHTVDLVVIQRSITEVLEKFNAGTSALMALRESTTESFGNETRRATRRKRTPRKKADA
jgi:hypothetical protein